MTITAAPWQGICLSQRTPSFHHLSVCDAPSGHLLSRSLVYFPLTGPTRDPLSAPRYCFFFLDLFCLCGRMSHLLHVHDVEARRIASDVPNPFFRPSPAYQSSLKRDPPPLRFFSIRVKTMVLQPHNNVVLFNYDDFINASVVFRSFFLKHFPSVESIARWFFPTTPQVVLPLDPLFSFPKYLQW